MRIILKAGDTVVVIGPDGGVRGRTTVDRINWATGTVSLAEPMPKGSMAGDRIELDSAGRSKPDAYPLEAAPSILSEGACIRKSDETLATDGFCSYPVSTLRPAIRTIAEDR